MNLKQIILAFILWNLTLISIAFLLNCFGSLNLLITLAFCIIISIGNHMLPHVLSKLRKPTKKELKLAWEIGTLMFALSLIVLGIRELIWQYNMGILFNPQYARFYFYNQFFFYNILPIFAVFLLVSYAVSGVFEIKKIMQKDPDIPSTGHL